MDDTRVSPTDHPINFPGSTDNTDPVENLVQVNDSDTVVPAPEDLANVDVESEDQSTAENLVMNTSADVRLQRINDYLDESLAKGSPFEASLGATNADLLLMAYRLGQGFEETLQQGPAGMDELEQLIPTMDQFLKVTKQIDRFSQLAIKLGDGKANSMASKLAAIVAGSGAAASEDSAS